MVTSTASGSERSRAPGRARLPQPATITRASLPLVAEDVVVVFVEVPSGSRNKYELGEELRRDRSSPPVHVDGVPTADYGFIEGTLGEDGDPLDALVLVGEPTFPGCRIRVRVVGVFHMADEERGLTRRSSASR